LQAADASPMMKPMAQAGGMLSKGICFNLGAEALGELMQKSARRFRALPDEKKQSAGCDGSGTVAGSAGLEI